MSACAVATCPNYHRKTKGKGVIYHVFPVCPNRSKIWISKCKRQDHINVKYARICSDHFRPSDCMDDMKNRLLGLNQKKILKPDAVPSVNLPLQDNGEDISSRSERKRKISILRKAKIRLKCLSPKKACETPSMEPFTTPTTENICSSCFETQKENALLLERIRFLEKELEKTKEDTKKNQRKKIKEMKTKAQIGRILTENKSLKSEVKKLSKIEENFKNILTATQINAVIENKSKIKWTAEDISRHLIIRSISRRAYEYWRNQIGIPLPSASTLKRWCSNFSCRPGMLHDVLLVMQKTFHSKPEAERVCILSFDEMHIDRKICYDVSEDQILGPFSKVQLVLARGIMAGWKQPVFFNFDTTMTKHLLCEIIQKIEEKGLIVKAIVSDLAGSSTLWKELEITSENNFFIHPLNCRKIWAFADPPHYLKLLRNHFLDTGLVLKDGTVLTKNIFEEVFKKDRGEYKLCLKLKPNLLTVRGNERQKVSPAKTLFSATTAKALLLLTGNQRAAEFFELVDSFFDIMNSSKLHPPSNKPLQAGYGLEKCFSQQEQILQNMKEEMNGMRVQGKKSLLPFQKGILISISSFSGLWNDLKNLKFSYILASRLTQDSLESLFSQIRGAGRFYDHPSSVEVIYRLRNLLLANKLPILSPKVNTREDSINECYLIADILKNAFAEKDIQEIHELPSEKDDLVAFENLCSEEFPMEWKIDEPSNYCGMTFSEHEGLKYIAVYISSRVRSEDSSLGYFSAEKTDSESALT
ncbi:Transposable element P transposase [Araneus ventricosus]|uniref:Transposable element P transposase n=1 Tax=Araneus ventricosus TaxID=182803 RepID=A0A4Y2ULZ9_ARAVE|nr:Transposable element P transposase [Araneus ventricosus]